MLLKDFYGCHFTIIELYLTNLVQLHKRLDVFIVPKHTSPARNLFELRGSAFSWVVNNLFHWKDFDTTVDSDHFIRPFSILGEN